MLRYFTSQGLVTKILPNGGYVILSPLDTTSELALEYQAWLAEGNTPEDPPVQPPAPDYIAFWDSLLISNVYQTIRTQALTSPAVLVAVTESLASLQDAKAGRPNVPAIQASINNLLAAGTFSQQDLAELGQLFVDANLQDTFTLTP